MNADDQANRRKQALAVVKETMRSRMTGQDVTDEIIEQRHPELMPELREELKTARAIHEAVLQAQHRPFVPGSSDADGPVFKEDDFLQVFLNGYDVLERIGGGGQGIVYKAIQTSTHRTVAIKVLIDAPFLTEQRRHRFAREIEAISQLRHPNIVTLYDCGEVCGRPYYAMEFVEGHPIDDHLLLNTPGIDQIIQVFIRITEAISYAHQRAILHRDLKPSNILVDAAGVPHILDFGLAKRFGEDDVHEVTISIPGAILGTLPYLSPEQAGGSDAQPDVRSDIYSLGVIFYRLLTEAYPYPVTGNPQRVRQHIIETQPRPLRHVMAQIEPTTRSKPLAISDDLDRVILKALAKEPERRYQSAAAFAEDLERCRRGEPVEAKADSKWYLLRKTLRQYRIHTAVALVFIAVLCGSALGMGLLWQRAEHVARVAQSGLQMGAHLRFGSVERDEGRVDQAIAMYEKAIEIGTALPRPDNLMLRYLYDAHHRLASLLYENKKDLAKADNHCHAAIEIAESVSTKNSTDLEWLRLLSFSYELLAKMKSTKGKWHEACELLQRAEAIHNNLAAIQPNNERHRFDAAFASRFRGRCLGKLGQKNEGLKALLRAHSTYTKLLDEAPDVLDYLVELPRTEILIAQLYLDKNVGQENHEAKEWLLKARRQLDNLTTVPNASSRSHQLDSMRESIRLHLAKIGFSRDYMEGHTELSGGNSR